MLSHSQHCSTVKQNTSSSCPRASWAARSLIRKLRQNMLAKSQAQVHCVYVATFMLLQQIHTEKNKILWHELAFIAI